MEGSREDARRLARPALGLIVTLALVACGGLGLLRYRSEVHATQFKSYGAVLAAYRKIAPGRTPASDLGRIGFDAARAQNVEVLSYLGMIERFMPRDSIRFDKLAPAVQSCIQARDRCIAYVFHPGTAHRARTGNILLDLLGLAHAAAPAGWQADVVLLVQDGRVAYKAMSAGPHTGAARQAAPRDFSGTALRTASRAL